MKTPTGTPSAAPSTNGQSFFQSRLRRSFQTAKALHDQAERDDQRRRLQGCQDVEPDRGRDQSEGKAGEARDQRTGKGGDDEK